MNFNLRDKREQKRLTQEELAIKAGVSRATISGIENGKITVTTTETLKKLSNALEIKISDFF
jgi:transcriptional regulator with XRE-family HTH domain